MTTAERNEATRRIEYLDEQIAELHVDHSFAAECGDRRSARRANDRMLRLEAERRHWLLKFPEVRYARELLDRLGRLRQRRQEQEQPTS